MSGEDKKRALFEAISSGNMPRVIDLVEEEHVDVSSIPDVLFFAILTSHADCVNYLLNKGAVPHAYTAVDGDTTVTIPLMFFAFPNIAKCELLKNAGCSINERSSVDGSVLIEYFRKNLICDTRALEYLASQDYNFHVIQQCNDITTDVLSSVFQYIVTHHKTITAADIILSLKGLKKHMDLNFDVSHNTLMRNVIQNSTLSSVFGALVAVSDQCNIHQNILTIEQVKEIADECQLRMSVDDVAVLLKVAITTDNVAQIQFLTERRFNVFAVNFNNTHNLVTACVHANARRILDYVLGLAFAIDKLEAEHDALHDEDHPAVKRLGYTREQQGTPLVHWNPLVVAACSKCSPEIQEMQLDAGFRPSDPELQNIVPLEFQCAFMKRWDLVQVLVDAKLVKINAQIASPQVLQVAQLPSMNIPMDFLGCQTKTLAALALTDRRADVLEFLLDRKAELPAAIGRKPVAEYIRDMKQQALRENEEMRQMKDLQRKQRIQQEIYNTQRKNYGNYTHFVYPTQKQGIMSTVLSRAARTIKFFK